MSPIAAMVDPPVIDIDEAEELLGLETFGRGAAYAASERVLRCEWNPGSGTLSGTVLGNHGRVYNTRVGLVRWRDDLWRLNSGRCSCPMQFDCKHVAALLVIAEQAAEAHATHSWRGALGALLPPAATAGGSEATPVAIEFASAPGPGFTLEARLLRPGARGGWVNSDATWNNLETLRYRGGDRQQVDALRTLYALHKASATSVYSMYDYGAVKSIALSRIDSPQLWPLLDDIRRTGVKLLRTRAGDELPAPGLATLALDVTADGNGDLTVEPVLDIDGVRHTAKGFIGSFGHGVAYLDDSGLRLARLPSGAAESLQNMVLRGYSISVPAEEAASFAAEYYPRLRSICPVTSSDGSFEVPEITGPILVLRADYLKAHGLEVTCEWMYRIGDTEIRCSIGGVDDGYRDRDAERRLAIGLDVPLERFGIRHVDGSLAPRMRLIGMDTMRFTEELMPLLADEPDVIVEVTGTPADYREAGESLVIGVKTTAVKGETDWFDLGVTITVEGRTVPFAQVFTALAAGQEYLLLPDGAYFSLAKPEFGRLRDLIVEARALTDDDPHATGAPRITRFQADLFDELAELGVVVRQAREWKRQVEGLRALGAPAPVEVPDTVRAELRPYQRDGFAWLATLHAHGLGGILADDMGLGKTVQAITLICHARQQDPGGAPFLVVAPASVMSNWAAEIARFAPHLNAVVLADTAAKSGVEFAERIAGADVVITSYTLFRLDFDEHDKQPWSALILDEAQYVKNRQAKTYQCARRLAAPTKLAITGTPMENNLMELWSLMSITAPGLFPDHKAFADYFAKTIERTRDTDRLGLLRRRIKPLMLRRTKELVAAELPAKQEQLVEVDLAPRHRAAYDKRLQRERQKVLGLLDDMQRNRFTILKSLTTMRQLALHPALVDPAAANIPSAKIEVLIEQMVDVVRGGHRALVFSQFTRFLGQVRDRLDAEGIEYCYLDGRTRDRAKAIATFKDGAAPAFLISLKAGGFGLNLTEADYCFLLDPWWNPAVEAQAVDRTHRIGQTRNVMVYRLIARDTIEEKVVALNKRKAALFNAVIDDGAVFGSALTADDIRELIS
ncbi:DEAD/DEAH box helicase [Mycolicibacterium brumae]|nr:DEAD/DEAH box helicase [Mycolicibacterium brumae]RWA16553.1 hypothetical protein MBRU_07455 [Mycolicibacterium brumae DSM 44177]UWW09772.1 SNF2 family helicase [Mycolicibacterium brumae]